MARLIERGDLKGANEVENNGQKETGKQAFAIGNGRKYRKPVIGGGVRPIRYADIPFA